MPLSASGTRVLKGMRKQYGSKKGTEVFYTSINKGLSGSEQWHKVKKQAKNKYTEALG